MRSPFRLSALASRLPAPLRSTLLTVAPAIALLLALALTAIPARATSVIAPTFAELVDEADAIYRATVTAVEARPATAPDGRAIIKTYVTFAVARTLKGDARAAVTLEFLGGSAGGRTLSVRGMPTFTVGTEDFVFVQRNGTQFCPLVAMMHGRYRVARDPATSAAYIARDNGLPLGDLAEIGQSPAALPAPILAARAASLRATAVTPAAFEAGILGEVSRPTVRARLN